MPRGHVVSDGAKVAALRGEADLTQWQLAAEAGYGLRTIGKIENGQPTGAKTLSAVATVLSRRLKRPVQMSDLMKRTNGHGDHALLGEPRLVEETLKFLDLTGWRPAPVNGNGHGGAAESRVVLHDHYQFRQLPPDLPVINLHYATSGKRIEGRCLSVNRCANWVNLGETREPDLKNAAQMRIGTESLPQEGPCCLQNRVEYVNAFLNPQREWFHSHVIFPTDDLTVVVLFPEHKPFQSVRGVWRGHPVEPLTPAPQQPVTTPNGKLVYWHLPAPRVGGTYQLEWTW